MGLQKLLKIILPKKTFSKLEEEGRRWFLVCNCGYNKSIWESGGIRAYASSGTKKELAYCPQCQKKTWMTLVKK